MDRENTHKGILLSHKKEHLWVSSNEIDEPRTYCTEWSKSEREIEISYTDTYMWNLRRWLWWIYFQGSNGETDREQTWGEGRREKGRCMERVTEICKPCVKQIANGNLLYDSGNSHRGSVTGWRRGWGGRWEGSPGGRRHGCTYDWFVLLCYRKSQNSVKQLSFN